MFENMSYSGILQSMLDRVPTSVDKREGSIIYDALAPAAMALMENYIALQNVMDETFAFNATREYLILRASERGIIPTPASYAVLRAVFDCEVKTGARFSLNGLNYAVTEQINETEYKVQCETIGTAGNKNFGALLPIDYIAGLSRAEITELLIPAEDEEDTELLRARYFASFDAKAYGGNVDDYLQKTNSIAGVGSTKVSPVWAGGGTVKLTILNSEFNAASGELIDSVQQLIDPTQDGNGIGIAPIGHVVTVDTAAAVAVDISTKLTLDVGYTTAGVAAKITNLVEAYLLEIRQDWAEQSSSIVRLAQIDTKIMSVDGVLDVAGTSINGVEENMTLSAFELPVLGVVACL